MTAVRTIPESPASSAPYIAIGQKYLITTREWFFGPDGRSYRAVFGTVSAVNSDADTLGIHTNRNATNWYAHVGCMTVAGCQIHYAVRADDCNTGPTDEDHIDDKGLVTRVTRDSRIFDADRIRSAA